LLRRQRDVDSRQTEEGSGENSPPRRTVDDLSPADDPSEPSRVPRGRRELFFSRCVCPSETAAVTRSKQVLRPFRGRELCLVTPACVLPLFPSPPHRRFQLPLSLGDPLSRALFPLFVHQSRSPRDFSPRLFCSSRAAVLGKKGLMIPGQ